MYIHNSARMDCRWCCKEECRESVFCYYAVESLLSALSRVYFNSHGNRFDAYFRDARTPTQSDLYRCHRRVGLVLDIDRSVPTLRRRRHVSHIEIPDTRNEREVEVRQIEVFKQSIGDESHTRWYR